MSTHDAPTPSKAATEQLRKLRDRRGYTQQQLADRLAELYAPDDPPLTRNAIAKIEAGKRGLSIDNWLALAAALDVPPLMLLAPLDGDRVAITPANVLHPDLAMRWLAGEAPLARSDHRAMHSGDWHRMSEHLRLFQDLRSIQAESRRMQARVQHLEFVGAAEDERRRTMEQYADVLASLRIQLTRISDAGLDAPRLDPRTRQDMVTLGQLDQGEA